MRYIPATALGLVLLLAGAPVLILAGAPAFAQMSMGGSPGGGGGAPGGANTPEPVAPTHDIAPPALPGAGAPGPLATGPVVQKPSIADPTQALFAAVNNGDYNAAQDALSRGADLNAQNALGETPLDLSIALNRSTITFLLLATRNETGSTDTISPGPAFPATATATLRVKPAHHKPHTTPAAAAPAHTSAAPLGTASGATAPAWESNPGTPNTSAGFMGFSPKN